MSKKNPLKADRARSTAILADDPSTSDNDRRNAILRLMAMLEAQGYGSTDIVKLCKEVSAPLNKAHTGKPTEEIEQILDAGRDAKLALFRVLQRYGINAQMLLYAAADAKEKTLVDEPDVDSLKKEIAELKLRVIAAEAETATARVELKSEREQKEASVKLLDAVLKKATESADTIKELQQILVQTRAQRDEARADFDAENLRAIAQGRTIDELRETLIAAQDTIRQQGEQLRQEQAARAAAEIAANATAEPFIEIARRTFEDMIGQMRIPQNAAGYPSAPTVIAAFQDIFGNAAHPASTMMRFRDEVREFMASVAVATGKPYKHSCLTSSSFMDRNNEPKANAEMHIYNFAPPKDSSSKDCYGVLINDEDVWVFKNRVGKLVSYFENIFNGQFTMNGRDQVGGNPEGSWPRSSVDGVKPVYIGRGLNIEPIMNTLTPTMIPNVADLDRLRGVFGAAGHDIKPAGTTERLDGVARQVASIMRPIGAME